jgi:hypothetical protein
MGMTTETHGLSAEILVSEVSSGDGVKQGSLTVKSTYFNGRLVQAAGWYFGVR